MAMSHYRDQGSENVYSGLIQPATTLLIDDDEDNIKVAHADGYQTLLYQPVEIDGSDVHPEL